MASGEPFRHDNADHILNAAADAGINFIDTGSTYGDGEMKGRGRLSAPRPERPSRSHQNAAAACSPTWPTLISHRAMPICEDSLRNMQLENPRPHAELHCPPTGVYSPPRKSLSLTGCARRVRFKDQGQQRRKVEEGLKATMFQRSHGAAHLNITWTVPPELFGKQPAATLSDCGGTAGQRLTDGRFTAQNQLPAETTATQPPVKPSIKVRFWRGFTCHGFSSRGVESCFFRGRSSYGLGTCWVPHV
jgi:hypothetical protein